MRPPVLAFCLALLAAPAFAAPQLGGYTNMSHDPGHGTQVEYLSPGGGAWLWYPGNAVIVPGKWKRAGKEMCFAYTANSYNPVTGHKGGGWECMPYKHWWGSIAERVEGDPLGLEGRRKVPFKLGKERVRFDKLVARVTGTKPPVEVTVNTAKGQEALSCKSILANAERSKADMAMAAGTYFHGIFMGAPCVKVDYDRAFDLLRRSGTDPKPFLRILQQRAATGNPSAVAALERYGN
ncbi:MAG TPA: hypothetical protein VIN06_19870 [Devosia sp.]